VVDDRNDILPGDRVLLVVEDDPAFAQILREAAHDNGFKAYIEPRGAVAVTLARELAPDAITLDLRLPDIDGRRVLARLKADLATRHIPVHVISVEAEGVAMLTRGARAVLPKPTTVETLASTFVDIRRFLDRPVKELLFVSGDDGLRSRGVELIGNGDVHTSLTTPEQARSLLDQQAFDCVVVDAGPSEASAVALVEGVIRDPARRHLPIVVYDPAHRRDLDAAGVERLAEGGNVRPVRSLEELFDGTALFLHRVAARLPEDKRRILEGLHDADAALAGRRVLIVDDDVRNIFAMTSLLERHGMEVRSAETGRDALDLLRGREPVDLVLMDIMLPEMDGYETMRAIRRLEGLYDLPIIALTAKAMKGDREKCIQAGASDYVAKPVDTDRLLATLRLWLTQS
jgi:CheY-like chemotaxis protein